MPGQILLGDCLQVMPTLPPQSVDLVFGSPGTVLDPFGGSGTAAAVAEKHGRKWISIDIRPSQIDLMHRRICEVRGTLPIPAVK